MLYIKLKKSSSFPPLARMGILALVATLPLNSQTVDFEASPYSTGKTVIGIEGWSRNEGPGLGNTDLFTIQSVPDNKWLQSTMPAISPLQRVFGERPGRLDLRWRWRARGEKVNFCLGVSGSSGGGGLGARASACLNAEGVFQAEGLKSLKTGEAWEPENWYYMHMLMNPETNYFVIYVSTDSLRLTEREIIPISEMNGVGSLNTLKIWSGSGSGTLDIDDISWESFAYWTGESDSTWSRDKNWSSGAVPDSLTNVMFQNGSKPYCFLDKNAQVKSITFANSWTGTFNLGKSHLSVFGKADLTGGSFTYQTLGMMRFSAAKSQSVTGPEGGRKAPPIHHNGFGTLRLDTRLLYAYSLAQTQGRLDFNGKDLKTYENFIIKNGHPQTLQNLDGRTIIVGKSARWEGISKDTLLNLMAKDWSISVPTGDTLVARNATIGNSKVTGNLGYAFQSVDGGNNSGWVFVAPPTFLKSPEDQNLKPGDLAIFKVSVGSKLPVNYKWLRNEQEILGAKDSVYSPGTVRLADHGATFSCQVSTLGGTTTSSAALLQVHFLAPIPTPQAQEFTETLVIKLTPTLDGAKTFFSRNGAPFTEYLGNVVVTDSTQLRAYSVFSGDTSAMGIWVYPKRLTPQAEMPNILPNIVSFADSQIVTLAPVTVGSTLFFTLDQSDPDTLKTSTTLDYQGPFTLRQSTTVRARAVKTGYRPSSIRTVLFQKKALDSSGTLESPKASPPGGFFADSQVVTLIAPTSAQDASLYYQFGTAALTKYSVPFPIRTSGTLKILASKGQKVSDTVYYTFTNQLQAPLALPKTRTFSNTLSVSLSSPIAGVTIRYTWDGADPTITSRPYLGTPLLLDSSATLKAIAIKGSDISSIMSETYTLIADPPQASYHGGDYTTKILIGLTTSSTRARIYYSLDGSTPGPENPGQLYSEAFWLDTSATLKAIALTGQGLNIQRSTLSVERFTFITPSRGSLDPGKKLEISAQYSLTSILPDAARVTVEILRTDSLTTLKGFRDIQFAIRLSLLDGTKAFPNILFNAPQGEARGIYAIEPSGALTYLTDADSYEFLKPGTYFLGLDTLAPQILLSGESFGAGDSTKVVLTIQDNVSSLVLNMERSDKPKENILNRSIGNPEILTFMFRNPPGSIQPLFFRLMVDDHHQKSTFPRESGAYHFLAQKNSGPIRTPAQFKIGTDACNQWDLVALPLAITPPITLTQLRKNNQAPDLVGAIWDATLNNYRFFKDDEPLNPGSALWLAAPTRIASLAFPSLQTLPRAETGAYKLTLHKGWNQVSNPTLSTLYWPVTREVPEAYDRSPLKGLHGYDASTQQYSHTNTLAPWRGYFVYYKGTRDTTIELRYQPIPTLPIPIAKTNAGSDLSSGLTSVSSSTIEAGPNAAIALTFNLANHPALRLGASLPALDGIGFEDESRPPPQNKNSTHLWSQREKMRLETDVMHWIPGRVYTWKLLAQSSVEKVAMNLPNDLVTTATLPEGYSAWAISKTRGIRFALFTGTAIPMVPGLGDSLDIWVGPTAELESRLASIPNKVATLQFGFSLSSQGLVLNFKLPQAMQVEWVVASVTGRIHAKGNLKLAHGIYNLPTHDSKPRLAPGMYVLKLNWNSLDRNKGRNASGQWTQKVAIP